MSDAERERTVEELHCHYEDGRLSSEELEERVARAYAARTRADLARTLRELPRSWRVRPRARRIVQAQRTALRLHAAAYASVNGSLIGVWALTGEGAFWPAQSLLPWGVLLGWHAYGSRRLRRRVRI